MTKEERRREQRRRGQISIFAERRLGERRTLKRDLLAWVRAFLGLPPLDD